MWMRKKFLKCEEAVDGTEGGSGGGIVTENSTSFAAEPAAPSAPADDSTESDVNWAGMAEELEHDEVVEGEEEVIEPVAAEPVAPAEPAPVAPVVPPVGEPAPAAPAPVVPASPVDTSSSTPAQTPEQYQAWRTGRVKELETLYALDEEATTAILTEPEKVLPALAAKVHMEVLEHSMRAVQAMMPVMMQQIQADTALNDRARNLFSSVNPDLVDPSFEPVIMQLGQVYRNVNKQASPEEAARAIGALARAALGIAQAPAPAAAAQAPVVANPAPFTPARGSGGVAVRGAASGNMFSQLADEFLRDD